MNFFKSIFGKREPDVEFVDLNELDLWLNSRIDVLKDLKITIRDCYDEIRRLITNTEDRLEILSNVNLYDEPVQEKLKQVVQGNRDIYIQNCYVLLKKVVPPVTIDYTGADEYIQKFKDEINSFNKKSARNFSITQNLIGKELIEVMESLKKMVFVVKNLKERLEADKPKLQEYKDILLKIENYKRDILACKENENYKLKMDEEMVRIKDEQGRIENKVSKLKKSKDFIKLENDTVNLKDIQIEKQSKIEKIIDLFSKVEKALKKYNNLKEDKLIVAYLNNSVEALAKDNNLEIVSRAKKIRELIEGGKIDISDEKKYKITDALAKINKDSLYELRISYLGAESEELGLRNRIENNKIMEDIEEEKSRAEEMKKSFKKEKNKEIEFVDLDKEKAEIEKDILRMTNVEVKIENEAMD